MDSPAAPRRQFWRIALLGAVLIVIAAVCLRQLQQKARFERRPHIILVTIDTLRKDRLGCYGAAIPRTPILDRLARVSYQFPNFVSASNNTNVSFASLHTGTFLRTHKVQGLSMLGYPLDAAFSTLAESLGDAGYLTLAAVSAPVVDGGASGLRQGFDVYLDSGREYAKQPAAVTNEKLLAALDTEIAEDATGAGAVFLWVHYFDPHWPYDPPDAVEEMFLDEATLEYRARNEGVEVPHSAKNAELGASARDFYRRQYTAEVRYADAQLGRLFDELDRRGILEDSVIIFTGDHGENLGEREDFDSFANHQRLYQQVSEPPLLIHLPGQRTGQLIETPVQTVDLLPTCLELAGTDALPEGLEGESLLSWLVDGAPADRTVFSEGAYQKEKVIRDGRYKLAYRLQPQIIEEDSFELYDVERDPAETVDLVDEKPEVARELRDAMEAFLGRVPIRLRVESKDGKSHSVRGLMRPIKSSFDGVTPVECEPGDDYRLDEQGLHFDCTVGEGDSDQLFFEADWSAALGALFEVDGRPIRLPELLLGTASYERTVYRSVLFLDDVAPGQSADEGAWITVTREDVTGGSGERERIVRVRFDAGDANAPAQPGEAVFELRVFGHFSGVRVTPSRGIDVKQTEERLQLRSRVPQGTIEFRLPAGITHLLTDFRSGDVPVDSGRIHLGRGLRTEPETAYPSILYSPRFRLTRDTRAGSGAAAGPGGAAPGAGGSGAGGSGAGGSGGAMAELEVLVRFESPFLVGPSGRASAIGDIDVSSLPPDVVEQLRRLGYLESSDNPQN